MKEYSIFIRNGSGSPYYLQPYKTLRDAQIALDEIVSLEEERGRFYYVDNDFFNNKYPQMIGVKYICIKFREISEWKKYSQEEVLKDSPGIPNDKIILLQNFIK